MMPMGPQWAAADEPELMMDINTTPLIDVLLVLLVMLIITIPIQLHAIDTQMPVTAGAGAKSRLDPIEIGIGADDRLTWQGASLSPDALAVRMAAIAQASDRPDILVRPDRRCSYAAFAHVLAESRRHGLTRLAVVGSEQFRQGRSVNRL
ncbi:MAG: biopolymer transporter ExbD [Burkholderiaceae bacterium]